MNDEFAALRISRNSDDNDDGGGAAVIWYPRARPPAQFDDSPSTTRRTKIYAPGRRAAGAIPRAHREPRAMTQRAVRRATTRV